MTVMVDKKAGIRKSHETIKAHLKDQAVVLLFEAADGVPNNNSDKKNLDVKIERIETL